MIRLPASTWILGGMTVALGALGGWLTWSVLSPIDQLAAVAPELSPLPASLPSRLAARVDYAGIRDQAVFYSSRTYIPEPDPALAGPPRPDYQFVAALVMPQNRSVAFLRRAGQADVVKVKVNDSLDGWHVATIEAQRVVIELNGEHFEFSAAAKPPTPGLTRVTLTPPITVASTGGSRVLGGHGSSPAVSDGPRHVETEARLYRPPQ